MQIWLPPISKFYKSSPGVSTVITGPKIAGSIPPERASNTQALVDYFLNRGVPANNILWNVVGESGAGGDFIIADMTVNSFLDNITIVNPGETLLVQDATGASTIDNITLELASGIFTIPDMAVASTIDGIVLALAGGTFAIADMTGASVIDNIVLQLAGGGATAVDDNFDRANSSDIGSDYTAITGLTKLGISANNAISPSGWGGVYRSTETFNANQYSECNGVSPSAYPIVRASAIERTYYYAYEVLTDLGEGWYAVDAYIYKTVNGGAPSQISTAHREGEGEGNSNSLRLEISGSTLTLKGGSGTGNTRSGAWTTLTSGTDGSPISGGKPGMVINSGNSITAAWFGDL